MNQSIAEAIVKIERQRAGLEPMPDISQETKEKIQPIISQDSHEPNRG